MDAVVMGYRCDDCGARASKWSELCGVCRVGPLSPLVRRERAVGAAVVAAPVNNHGLPPGLESLEDEDDSEPERISTGIESFDRVLGKNTDGRAGLAVPSVIQFGGAPGCGKSTLLSQALDDMVQRDIRAAYVAAEESKRAIRVRLKRLGLEHAVSVPVAHTNDINVALNAVTAYGVDVLVIDSINKMRDPERDTKDKLANMLAIAQKVYAEAHARDWVVFLINHINRKGDMIGLKEVEHEVDAVMMFAKLGRRLRRLSCPGKNRYGDTAEQADFEMRSDGRGLNPIEAPEEDDEQDQGAGADQRRARGEQTVKVRGGPARGASGASWLAKDRAAMR